MGFTTGSKRTPSFNRDLMRERARQKHFFEAWFGGAPTYFDATWPPGLKAVHESVSISRGMADRWLGHFLATFAEVRDAYGRLAGVRQIREPVRPQVLQRELLGGSVGSKSAARGRLHGCWGAGGDRHPLGLLRPQSAAPQCREHLVLQATGVASEDGDKAFDEETFTEPGLPGLQVVSI